MLLHTIEADTYLPMYFLPIVTEISSSQPESISWATTLSQLYTIRAFTWNVHSSGCPALHYNIMTSNCGSCPTTTNHTNATCTDVPTDGSLCTFSVQTVVCGSIDGGINQVLLYNNNAPGKRILNESCRTFIFDI